MATSDPKSGKDKSLFRNQSPPARWKQLEDWSDDKKPFTNYKFCTILMLMAFLGAVSMQMSLSIGPDDCDNDNFFEAIGGLALWISAIGIPINGIIFLRSFFEYEMNSTEIFLWSIAHIAVLFFTFLIFGEAILQDMFCGGNGPHYDIGAGF